MFRVLSIPTDTAAPLSQTTGEPAARPPSPDELLWIDLEGQDADSMRLLQERFGFHPLAIEDCLNQGQRPKLEEYGGFLFVVTHVFACGADPAVLEMSEVHFFLGERFLVTVHEGPVASLDAAWQRAATDGKLIRTGADFLLYMVLDAMVDAHFPIIDLISEAVDTLEEAVLDRAQPAQLQRIVELRRSLTTMRRVLAPERDIFGLLARRGADARIGDRTAVYFRDVYDHLVRINESIDATRELLANAKDAYLSMMANRTNDVMKRLGLLSAVFMPLAFVTGFFGQNFEHMPYASDQLMYTMAAGCIVIPAAMAAWFYRSGWF